MIFWLSRSPCHCLRLFVRPRLASEGGFHGCARKNVLLKFRSAGVVYAEAAQPELGMLIVGDVDAALAALHRGDLGAFRFQKNHRERAEWTRLFTRSPERSSTRIQIRSRRLDQRSGTSRQPQGHWSPFSIVGFAGGANS